MIVGPYRPLLRQNLKRPARRWPLWWSESTKTPIFVVFLLTRRKVGYMKLKNGLYCQKNTRKTCLFSPPNTAWPAEGAKRPFSPIFVAFDKYTQIGGLGISNFLGASRSLFSSSLPTNAKSWHRRHSSDCWPWPPGWSFSSFSFLLFSSCPSSPTHA